MRPAGLILDFGGIIALSEKRAGWERTVAATMADMLGDASPPLPRLRSDLTAAATAYSLWRDAMSRPMAPSEISAKAYVHDFIAADWPLASRHGLAGREAEICAIISRHQVIRRPRPGVRSLLEWCADAGLPVAVASNALSGTVHRNFLIEHDLAGFVRAQIYSDEARVRKPNPRLITLAADALGLDVSRCWYVGDRLDRDVLCGQRAGTLASLLIPTPGATPRPYETPLVPDRELPDLLALEQALRSALI